MSPGTSRLGTCSVSIAIVSPSARRSRFATIVGSEGETLRKRPSLAPAATVFSSIVRLVGRMPRRRMSSVNEVIVSSWAIFGSLTKVPLPRRRIRCPSRTSSSRAARTVRRETPKSTLSCRSEGIDSPIESRSISSSTLSRVSVCLVTRTAKWSVPLRARPHRVRHRTAPTGKWSIPTRMKRWSGTVADRDRASADGAGAEPGAPRAAAAPRARRACRSRGRSSDRRDPEPVRAERVHPALVVRRGVRARRPDAGARAAERRSRGR